MYTPPAANAVDFTLDSYIAPASTAVDFNLDSGVATFEITVAQTMPVPSQDSTLQTAMPVIVAQTMPTPSQAIVAATGPATATRPLGAGGPRGAWDYRPPVFAIRTKGRQEAPAPGQRSRLRTRQSVITAQSAPLPRQSVRVRYIKKVAFCAGSCYTLPPTQGGQVWPHRLKHIREEEERKVILMLLGMDIDEYELQLSKNQAEAETATD
jgi:hypothetical protein